MKSDRGATYAGTVTIDCTQVEPTVALPSLPRNGMALSAVADRPRVDIVHGRILRRRSRAAGAETVQICGYCIAKGYLETFRVVGAEMLQPACDADGLNVSDWTLHQNRQGLPEERTASTGLG